MEADEPDSPGCTRKEEINTFITCGTMSTFNGFFLLLLLLLLGLSQFPRTAAVSPQLDNFISLIHLNNM